jgi:hypothetical protein
MNDEFENQLRRALRPVDAPAGFADRLMKRLPEQPALVPVAPQVAPGRTRQLGLPAALAASLLVAVMLGQQLANQRWQHEQAEGLAASRELLQALRVTSRKLDLAYEAVNDPPPLAEPMQADESGNEENRT